MKRSARSVFVNCPFDDAFRPLFRAIVFKVEYCGFSARSALEESNSGESRIEKILRIVRESRYGIHDISRTELGENGLPRFNMPFELGLFLGMRALGGPQGRKVALILDRERYRDQQFLSDMAGHDIASHDRREVRAIEVVRDWLASLGPRRVPGRKYVLDQFSAFTNALPSLLADQRLTEDDLDTFADYLRAVRVWVRNDSYE